MAVVTVAVRQAGRDVVVVADGAAPGRRLPLPGLSGWDVVSVPESAAVVRVAVAVAVAVVSVVLNVRARRGLGRRRRRGRRRRGRGCRGCGCRGCGGGGRRWPRPRPAVVRRANRRLAAGRGPMRRTADRRGGRAPVDRSQSAGRGPGPRWRSRRRAAVRPPGRRRRHRDLRGRRRGRAGAGVRADPDRPEVGRQTPRARVEDEGHRRPAEHERDQRRPRYAGECPECTSFAAFVGRQRPFPPPFPWPSPALTQRYKKPGRTATRLRSRPSLFPSESLALWPRPCGAHAEARHWTRGARSPLCAIR